LDNVCIESLDLRLTPCVGTGGKEEALGSAL